MSEDVNRVESPKETPTHKTDLDELPDDELAPDGEDDCEDEDEDEEDADDEDEDE